MKKILLALAACAVSAAAFAQPLHPSPESRMERRQVAPHHRKQKVWVPAHREGRRRVPGHYIWR
jgi:Ni/Co efflux regulator RcnB